MGWHTWKTQDWGTVRALGIEEEAVPIVSFTGVGQREKQIEKPPGRRTRWVSLQEQPGRHMQSTL